MALFRADIAGILTVRTFKMLFQIVFRESGVGKESAASVRKRPDLFLQRSEGSVIACEQLFAWSRLAEEIEASIDASSGTFWQARS